MKQIEKLKILSKSVFNDKDYNLILEFIKKHDFDSISDIVRSEVKKEARLCVNVVTKRYIELQELTIILMKFDISDVYMDKCANYEEE